MYSKEFKANIPFQTSNNEIAVLFTTPGAVTLQYSVDGVTWTDWSTTLSDANCVIANIPNGLYLKFSSDGKYTD